MNLYFLVFIENIFSIYFKIYLELYLIKSRDRIYIQWYDILEISDCLCQ